jgi:predicted dehydrogenase
MRRLYVFTAAFLVTAAVAAPQQANTAGSSPQSGPAIRVGLIGLDTSHAVAFTELLNDESRADHVPGARVVAAFKGGSPDIEASRSRIEKFTAEVRDTWHVELVDSIEALVQHVDAVLLTSVDGRVHLEQARPVIATGKPLFVDKPFTASVRDAIEIARLARERNAPVFSSSSLRFADDVQAIKKDPRLGRVLGAITWGPAELEPHHPDLFWYGVHAVEMLYTYMGPGCERLTRTSSEEADVVVGHWTDGRIGVVRGERGGSYAFGRAVFGPKAVLTEPDPSVMRAIPPKRSSYYGLMTAIVEFFRTRQAPVPLDETIEIMAFMEAADLSKSRDGASVELAEVMPR